MLPDVPGNGHKKTLHFTQPPQRVVSLVPSMTESMFDLGFGDSIVGITDYCLHPAKDILHLPRLGGTRDPCLDKIVSLKPDLVLANWEENTRQTVEVLEAAGLAVWVTFPQSVRQSLDVLWLIVGLFHSRAAAIRLETLEISLDWAISAAAERQPLRCFCPIWYGQTQTGEDWWMTFNHQTYSSDLLELLGCQNVFMNRERRYPLEADLGLAPEEDDQGRDKRYPCVRLEEIIAAQPEMVLLPDEPFAFNESHRQRLINVLGNTLAAQQSRIHLLDGSLITWHGTRLARALQELPPLIDGC